MLLDGRGARARLRGAGAELRTAEQLCRSPARPLPAPRWAPAARSPSAAPQEAPLFAEEAADAGGTVPLQLRQHPRDRPAGRDEGRGRRAEDGRRCSPPPPCRCRATPLVPLDQRGRDAGPRPRRHRARAAAAPGRHAGPDRAADRRGARAPRPRRPNFPVLRGRARSATGWLGAFEVVVDGHARPRPSSRAAYAWGPARDGATSRCDLILDLTRRRRRCSRRMPPARATCAPTRPMPPRWSG